MQKESMEVQLWASCFVKGALPPWKSERKEMEMTEDEAFVKYADLLPIFATNPDNENPIQSAMDIRDVDEVMYQIQTMAEEFYPKWECFQLQIARPDTGEKWILKMYRTNVGRTTRVEIGGDKSESEIMCTDIWFSQNFGFIIEHTRPFVMPILKG